MKTRAYMYNPKPQRRNEVLQHTAAILAMLCVETVWLIEYLNNCINQIIHL